MGFMGRFFGGKKREEPTRRTAPRRSADVTSLFVDEGDHGRDSYGPSYGSDRGSSSFGSSNSGSYGGGDSGGGGGE